LNKKTSSGDRERETKRKGSHQFPAPSISPTSITAFN